MVWLVGFGFDFDGFGWFFVCFWSGDPWVSIDLPPPRSGPGPGQDFSARGPPKKELRGAGVSWSQNWEARGGGPARSEPGGRGGGSPPPPHRLCGQLYVMQ